LLLLPVNIEPQNRFGSDPRGDPAPTMVARALRGGAPGWLKRLPPPFGGPHASLLLKSIALKARRAGELQHTQDQH